MKKLKIASLIFGLVTLFGLLALQSVFAYSEPTTFGSVAESLTVDANILKAFMHFVCFIMASVFFVMAFSMYRAHRFNPKLVPLDRPIMYLVFALLMVALPMLGKLFLEPSSPAVLEKELRGTGLHFQDIDAPLVNRNSN
jgi:hypothetical protein